MSTDKIVHFVYFETTLNSDEFIAKWEHYLRSANSNTDVTVQESKKNNLFTYIAEHRCNSEEFLFTFTRAAKSNRLKEVEIKTTQLGGYSILQKQQTDHAKRDESKVFVFLNYSNKDFNHYKQVQPYSKLNIYEAYYENCAYAYILEYFVKNTDIPALQQQLQKFSAHEISIYKEHNVKKV
jgi:hypothetical protein